MGEFAYPWTPDPGDGSYKNPVLYADYSDPDAIRVGDDFYLTASSFNCTPGLPLLHSRDLVNWTLIGHALRNLPGERFADVQHGCGVWAPALRFHQGRFWIFFPMPDEGIFVTTAEHPAGPWSEPHCLIEGKGLIDPCPLWDDDGQAYLVHAYARSRSGIKHRLRVRPMAPDGSRLLGEGQIIADGEERYPTIEGPKFLKQDGWYYVLAPAGGVATGWQTVLRSRHIYGPYEDRIVLHQGETPVNGPHQGALVDAPGGAWWFLHFQDAGVYGRIVHLQPVTWRGGWPEMGVDRDGDGIGEPVSEYRKPVSGEPAAVPATSDDFDSPSLGLQWQWHANHRDDWHSLAARPGHLRLFAAPPDALGADLHRVPNLLLQKFPARTFAVETALRLGPEEGGGEAQAGLCVMGRSWAALSLRRAGNAWRLVYQGDGAERAEAALPSGAARLRVVVEDGGLCRFAYAVLDGSVWVEAGEPFPAREGEWIGAKVGVFCLAAAPGNASGYADFDYFRFSPPS